jgi:hypothetical protein
MLSVVKLPADDKLDAEDINLLAGCVRKKARGGK